VRRHVGGPEEGAQLHAASAAAHPGRQRPGHHGGTQEGHPVGPGPRARHALQPCRRRPLRGLGGLQSGKPHGADPQAQGPVGKNP
jgi:hypothetical protein